MNISLGVVKRPSLRIGAAADQGRQLSEIAAAPPFLSLLVAASLIDWLVTRTITRFAIFVPKTPAMIAGYQLMGWVGQVGSTLAALLALAGLVWIAREEWRTQRFPWLGAMGIGLAGLSLLFLVVPPGQWLLLYHVLVLGSLLGLGWRALHLPTPVAIRSAGLLPVLAMGAASLHQAAPTIYTILHLPGPPAWGTQLFFAGEVLVVTSAVALWWGYGRAARGRSWFLAALPALLFAVAYLSRPAMTATIVIWSNGLSLFLPWWLYAGALWLAGVTVHWTAQSGDRRTAGAILLLAAAGYAPQFSSYFYFGLMALWLLSRTEPTANEPGYARRYVKI